MSGGEASRPAHGALAGHVGLPYGQGPQHRAAVAATVSTGAGELRVVATHLQQYRSGQATRIDQLEVLLPGLGSPGSGALVVGGDFNARPEDPEIALMTGAGYLSAVDEVGDPLAMTIPSAALATVVPLTRR